VCEAYPLLYNITAQLQPPRACLRRWKKSTERRQLDHLPWGAGERDPGVGYLLSVIIQPALPETPLNSLPMQKAQTGGGEPSWAEEMFVMRLTYGKEEEISGVFLCHVKSLLVRVICSEWIRHQNRGNKGPLLLSFLRGTRIWVSPQTRGLPPPIPIFARTKRCIPSQVCFAVCLQWKFRLAFSASLHTPAA
jgi:hypothetical protein